MFKSLLKATAFVLCVYRINCSIDGSISNEIQAEKTNTSERSGRSLNKECNNNLNAKCIKIHVLSFLEDLSSKDELTLLPGLSIVKENYTSNTSPEEMAAELSRQFPGKLEEKLNRFLIYRLQDYLDGHSLRYKLLDPKTSQEALDMANGDGESVGRKGGGGGLGGGGKGGGGGALLAAALMMKGALGAAALGALALLAGKALMTALMSLLLSALVGLKGGGGHKSTTYEIITKPEVSHHHSHSHEEHHEHEHGHHGGYRRAYDADYNSYMPYDNIS
ncbi:PREDICTED: uncharacterized protein LOC106116101 [Papilio xuthus]|uniref:Uncharacterized protein LOC106116101 n=1 Tax=Papilio xuthus TaxID=66420 RepID=A0AAJ6Z4N8_PAPXU|nr:PREDICTED: uncharacterized protein LOC106116101 [Papilio xuthus]